MVLYGNYASLKLANKKMEQKDDGMLSKLKTTFSIIYGILVWVARLSSTIKLPPHYYLGVVLSSSSQLQKNDCHKKYHLDDELHSPPPQSPSCLSPSSSSSSFSLSSTGDLIGSESGVYLCSSEDPLLGEQRIQNTNSNSFLRDNKKILEREIGKKTGFPPPLTTIVSKKNPRGFDKYYVDGRLIVKEKTAKHLEYFETYRENGRLVMNLVPFDNTSECCHLDYESLNIDIRAEKDDTCDHFSGSTEGDGNFEYQDIPMDKMEYHNFESSVGKKYKKRKKSVLNPSFFSERPLMNNPIHV